MPFGISFPAPLAVPLARSRLKSNLGALALFIFARTLFTPYLFLRTLVVEALNKVAKESGGEIMWWIEFLVTASLVYNIAEAAYWVQNPSSVPATPQGLKLVPVLKSSPLTRSYPPTPDPSTPSKPAADLRSSTLQQSLYRSTGGVMSTPQRPAAPGAAGSTPERGSPSLSASTARVLNLAQPGTPSQTGLFYDDSMASPSRAVKITEQELGASKPAAIATPPHPRAKYNVVDRDEREWVEGVWKAVKGKGHIGL